MEFVWQTYPISAPKLAQNVIYISTFIIRRDINAKFHIEWHLGPKSGQRTRQSLLICHPDVGRVLVHVGAALVLRDDAADAEPK